MLSKATVVPFIPITDGARAREFYVGTLGLEVEHEDDFALVLRSNGTSIRLPKVREFTPQSFTICGWGVDDVRGTVEALAAKGVEFVRYPGMGQDELGIWTPPGSNAGVAWFKDPDGNLLSISGSAH